MKKFITTMWKFYSTSWFYVLYFFVVHMLTLLPWFYDTEGNGIWYVRAFFLAAYLLLTYTRYHMVLNYEKSEEERKQKLRDEGIDVDKL